MHITSILGIIIVRIYVYAPHYKQNSAYMTLERDATVVGTICLLVRFLRGLSDRVKLWCRPQPWLGPLAWSFFAGAVAPADLAGTDVPAVSESYSSAVDAKGVPLVIQTCGRWCVVV